MAVRKSTKYLIVHVTATAPSQDFGRAEIAAMHKARGFADIGYNRLIRQSGKVEIGRGDDAIGAHVEGFNSIAWGIVGVGGLNAKGKPADTWNAVQLASLESELKAALKRWPSAVICGHRDLSPDLDGDGVIEASEYTKQCPCRHIIPWAKAKGLPAANIRGPWAPSAPVKPEGPDARNAYLQRLLARAGYQFGAIDGHIGPKTKAAIRVFQLASNLPRTGEFDTATVLRLRVLIEGKLPSAA